MPERRPGFWTRFLHQRWAIAGLIFLLIVIVAAIFAPLVAPHPPDAQDINAINAGPSFSHWFGHGRPRARHPEPTHLGCPHLAASVVSRSSVWLPWLPSRLV